MVKVLHDKVRQLQLRAVPAPTSRYTDKNGEAIDFKIKANDDNTIEGYLAVFGRKDDYGTVPMRGCFAKSIQERGPKSNSKYKIVFLWQHDMSDPIGQIIELEEDDYGLRFKAALDLGVPSADRCLIQVRSGTVNQFSYGFDYVWDKMVYDETMDAVLMYEIALWEGSAVTIGAEIETYAIRSTEDFNQKVLELQDEVESIVKALPRKNQLEVRQLLTKHITLYTNKPVLATEQKQKRATLDLSYKPDVEEVAAYKIENVVKQFLNK